MEHVVHNERRIIIRIRLIIKLCFAHPTVAITIHIALVPFTRIKLIKLEKKFGKGLKKEKKEKKTCLNGYIIGGSLSSGRNCCIGTGASVIADFRGIQPLRRSSIKSRNLS